MEEISVREIMEMILRNKKMVIMIVIACLIVGPVGAIVANTSEGQARAVISVNFPGIEKGLNPDGSPFDISMLTSPSVIQDAISKTGLDTLSGAITQIRNSITVTPIVSDSTAAAAENAIKAGKSYEFYPSRYSVVFNIGKSLNISRQEGADLLDAIVRKYGEYFNEHYSKAAFLSDSIVELDLDRYDYYEAVEVIESNVSSIKSFLGAKISEERDFRTAGTNMSFSDIFNSIGIIADIDLANAKSLVSQYNLSKNPDKLVSNLRYKIKMLESQKAEKEGEARVALDMMESYKRENNLLILPSQIDGNYNIQGSGSYYEVLAEKALAAQTEAQRIGNNIAFYNSEVQKFLSDSIPAASKSEAEAEAALRLKTVVKDLGTWVAAINQAAQEYYNYKYSRLISNISGVNTAPAADLKMIIAVSLLIGLAAGIFTALFKEYWKKSASAPAGVAVDAAQAGGAAAAAMAAMAAIADTTASAASAGTTGKAGMTDDRKKARIVVPAAHSATDAAAHTVQAAHIAAAKSGSAGNGNAAG